MQRLIYTVERYENVEGEDCTYQYTVKAFGTKQAAEEFRESQRTLWEDLSDGTIWHRTHFVDCLVLED